MAAQKTLLDSGWEFKEALKPDEDYLPVSQFPTNVHLDLMHHKLIPDPFMGKNELDVQWVGERQWTYRTTFKSGHCSGEKTGSTKKVMLAFDGLDTFATVRLNGEVVLESENMFLLARVDVSKQLAAENTLEITFDSAYLRGWKLVEKFPDHKWGCWNGDNSRLAVRKAQYHWGWDWGPTLMTCGPWRPVTLEIYESRINDLHFTTSVDSSLKSAKVTTYASVEGNAPKVRFDISLDGKTVASEVVKGRAGKDFTHTFDMSEPALWYPVRYGKQPLYSVTATLLDGSADDEIDTVTKKMGIRRVELVQDALKEQPGTSFFFRVNGIPIFCGGSDWIPADNFVPRLTRDSYRDWIRLLRDGNQVMVRVWGGGIYEEQHFYDACDEMGILVWQDFMFGCGNYPAWPGLLESIDKEARENIKLLRHHASIVIWAGNNEDYQYAEGEGLTYDLENKDCESWLQTDFPARYIYEKVLADACKDLMPDTFYHFGSPWSGRDTRDPTVGDIHQWNVWHGTQEKYQNFDKLVGRFVSEFGMEAFPSVKTIDAFLPLGKDDPDRYPQSSTVDFHNKAAGHERRIALYLVENFRYAPDPLEHFVYCTQLMQAECLASAYRLWKRQWKGPGREYCGGALVWQLNDCWPVTSWAICDYYLRPKHAYYTVKREMAALTVGMTRREHRHPRDKYTRVDVDVRTEVDIWGSNLTVEDVTGVDCVVKAWDVETGKETYSQTVGSGLCLPANQSTEIFAMDVPVPKSAEKKTGNGGGGGEEGRTVVAAYLYRGGEQLARYVNWPEPLKYLHLQKPARLVAELSSGEDGSGMVEVSAEVPVKGVALECDDDAVVFEDNLVDVVPGEIVYIKVKGASAKSEITTRYLGMLN